MKKTLFSFFTLALSITVLAQESFLDPTDARDLPSMIRVMVEYIEVPLPELTKLLAEPRVSTNDNDLRNEIGKLVENKIAKQADTQFVLCRSGETAKTEGILEYISPSEYDPPSPPRNIIANNTTHEAITFSKHLATPTIPMAWDTRPLGSTLEIQPQIDWNRFLVNLQFAPELVEHVHNQIWAEWYGAQGEAHTKRPLFFVNRMTTGLTVVNGQYCLVGTNSMPGENGTVDYQRKLLLFLRADIITSDL